MFNKLPVTHATVAEADNYLGSPNTFSFCIEDCSLRYHDGCCCGGKILNEAPTPFDPTDLLNRIAALEALNPIVDVEVVGEDILATYLDGSTETLDLPAFSASADGAGLITFDLDGTPFGPFDTGPHATDTDTFSTSVDNGDGTVTVTYANGSTATYATGPHTVDTDTDTTYSFVTNADGSITITGSDGSTFTGPAGTVDTDTFATLAGQTITFANGDTLVVPAADTDDEVGATVVADGVIIDPTDTSTWPALVAPAAIQMVVDSSGNFVGFIDAAGAHKSAAGITVRRLASDAVNASYDLHTIASGTQVDTMPLSVPVTLTRPSVVTFTYRSRVEFFQLGVVGRQIQATFQVHDELTSSNIGASLGWRDYVDTSAADGNLISGTMRRLMPAGTYDFNVHTNVQTNNLDPASIVRQQQAFLEVTWLEET